MPQRSFSIEDTPFLRGPKQIRPCSKRKSIRAASGVSTPARPGRAAGKRNKRARPVPACVSRGSLRSDKPTSQDEARRSRTIGRAGRGAATCAQHAVRQGLDSSAACLTYSTSHSFLGVPRSSFDVPPLCGEI